MPSPGYIQGQYFTYEQLYSSSGTIVYDLYAQIPQGSGSGYNGDTFGIRCCPGGRKREGAWHSDRQPLWQNYSCRAEYTSHKALHRSKHRACCSNEHSGHCCSPGKGQITAEPGCLTTQKGAPNGCNTHR